MVISQISEQESAITKQANNDHRPRNERRQEILVLKIRIFFSIEFVTFNYQSFSMKC